MEQDVVPTFRPAEAESNEARSLLIVDDQSSQLKLMTLLLQHAFPGCRTCEVQDPTLAVELARTQEFDCALVDYQMPKLNGVELASQLRALKPHLPVILCTGGGDEMLVVEAMTSGITQYLPKTRVNPESLRRTVMHAVQIMSHERLIAEQRQELEHFSYALSHDFKQPIRQIKTFSQMVVAGLDDGDSEAIRAHANFLSKAAERLSRLVDVMSQYALLGKPPELREVQIEKVVLELEAALQPFIEERDGGLESRVSGTVMGNEALLYQILQNLVVNGFKYNRSREPRVSISADCDAGVCTIRVKDNGIGIAPEFHERVFQPLMRLHAESEYEGSGLGLALARKAALSQGGTISCVSEVGKGSEFIVTLPAAGVVAIAHRAS